MLRSETDCFLPWTSLTLFDQFLSDPLQVAGNMTYKKAILQAIEGLNDYQSRSNIDLIRRSTKYILEEHAYCSNWNEKLFVKTLKDIIRDGEIQQCAHIFAELSPEFKRMRADSLVRKLDEHLQADLVQSANQHPLYEKNPPHHGRPEHDKWKIVPKRIYDKSV